MDLCQYLLTPHERPSQQPARHNSPVHHHQYRQTINTLDPRLAQRAHTTPAILPNHNQPIDRTIHLRNEIGSLNNGWQQLQQQPQQHLQGQQQRLQDQVITREQVINGLTAYPDILVAILRSGHIPNRTQSATRALEQHSNTLPLTPRPTLTSAQQINENPFSDSAIPSSPPQATQPPRFPKRLCFWYYHQGNCTNDPSSPTYDGSSRPCPFLHSTEGMQEVKVQPGKESWHRQLGDCGLELCKFSSNYKFKDELEAEEQRKKSFREQRKERKKEKRRSGVVQGVDGKDGDGVSEPRAEHQDVMGTASSILLLQEQNIPDIAPTNSTSTTPTIPTSPRAGRYAKGSRFSQTSVSSATPTPSTLKRKASAPSSQNTPTPASKKVKTSASMPSTQIDPQPASTTPLSKHATRRLKRTKASQPLTNGTSSIPSTTLKPLDIIPYTTNHTHPSVSRSDHSKPHHQTCFAWYHDQCPYSGKAGKKGKKCAELHALTDPPSFVIAPEGYVHEGGVCGRDWCGGDWRGKEGEIEGEGVEDDGEIEEADRGLETDEDEEMQEVDDGEGSPLP
jgi:hypothetical protein